MEVLQIAISIKDALQLPIMQKTRLVAGKRGIENQIKWVTIIEVLEDIERLQKGEFLITTGFKLIEDENRLESFHQLLRSKVLSGVAIYTSFYMKKIPESFIDIANKHDLPLIEIPTDINFSEITRAILEQIVNKQTYLLEQSEKIHYELTNLILNDQNLSEVTNHLARLTSANIIIYNEFYSIIHSNVHAVQSKNSSQTSFSFHEQSIDLLNDLLRSREKESKVHVTFEQYVFTIYPIIAKQACFGWIVLLKPKEKWQELDDIAIERAAPIYAMEFLKKQAIEETQLRIQNNLLEDIFNNNYLNEQLIIDQALKMDYDLSVPQCVFHLTFQQPREVDFQIVDRLYHMIENLLIQKNKQHIIQTKLHSVIFLTNANRQTSAEQQQNSILLANEVLEAWEYHFPNIKLIIGIGRVYDRVKDLRKSAQEAQYAVTLRSLIDEEVNIVHYNDLGMYDLLLEMYQNDINLTAMYEENIQGLLSETEREIDLIETIDIFFKNNQSIQKSAKKLFIHRHTLRYRLTQIEQKTGLDLKNKDDLLKLQLSVMAYKLVTTLKKNEKM